MWAAKSCANGWLTKFPKPRGEQSEPRGCRNPSMKIKSASHKMHPPTQQNGFPQRVLLQGINWNAYKALCDATTNRRVRMTYDAGDLEIMVTSFEHDNF